MARMHIEPGVLRLFRMSIGLVGVYKIIQLLTLATEVAENSTALLIVNVLGGLGLLVYLYSFPLQNVMGRWYIPTAVILYSVMVFVSYWVEILWNMQIDIPPELIMGRMHYHIFYETLLIMFIIGTQYNLKAVTIYIIVLLTPTLFLLWTLPESASSLKEYLWAENIGASILTLFISWMITQIVGTQKENRQELTQKNILLTEYAITVERLAISHERNRMARELHDTLAHTLSAVAVQIEALNRQLDHDPDNARSTVQQLRELTRSGLKEARHALKALRASPLEDLGFPLAMQQLVNAMIERSGMTVMLQIDDGFDDLRSKVEQSVYRITEEALNNANRHAHANRVDVVLGHKGHGLELTITDDGCGFNLQATSSEGHYGLTGMRERAILCDGELRIETQPGTKVIFTIEELT